MDYEQKLREYVQLSKEVMNVELFSSWINDKLDVSGKSQVQVSKEVNCTSAAIHTYCKGLSFPKIHTLEKLLDVLD